MRVFILVTLLLVGAAPAISCECRAEQGNTTAERVIKGLQQSDAVFSGKVTEIEVVPIGRSLKKRVTIELAHVWKGKLGEVVSFVTGYGGPDCGFQFKAGESYLIYAYTYKVDAVGYTGHDPEPDLDRLATHRCLRTKRLAEAERDELKALDDENTIRKIGLHRPLLRLYSTQVCRTGVWYAGERGANVRKIWPLMAAEY